MLHTCLSVYLPPCLCVRLSISVCVGESEGSSCLDRLLACEFELCKVMRISADHRHSPAALLFLFSSSPATAAAGRTVRKVDGDSDSDGSCCPTVLSRRPFLQSAIGCASPCRIVAVPGLPWQTIGD